MGRYVPETLSEQEAMLKQIGLEKIDELFDGFTTVNSACVRREIFEEAQAMTDKSLVPIDLYLTYSWVD